MPNWRALKHLFLKALEDRTWQLTLIISGSRKYESVCQHHTPTGWSLENEVSNSGNVALDQRHSKSQSDFSGRICALWHPQFLSLLLIAAPSRHDGTVCLLVFLVPAVGSLK